MDINIGTQATQMVEAGILQQNLHLVRGRDSDLVKTTRIGIRFGPFPFIANFRHKRKKQGCERTDQRMDTQVLP